MKKNWQDLTFFDAPKKDPYDWFQAVPEAHDLSGKAAAHYFGRILRAPVEWMHYPFDVVDVPEAFGAEPHEPAPPEERQTYYQMLGTAGRYMGETGYLGAEGSAEDPWVGQDLTPEILEVLMPLATEIAMYPAGGRVLEEGGRQLVSGIEEVLGAAAGGYERMMRPVGEAYRFWYSRNVLPGKLTKTSERLTSLGEEAMRGVEWWRDVGEAQKLAMLDDAERQIAHTLDWVEASVLAEDDMAMNLAMGRSPQTPRAPGPGMGRVEGRVTPEYASGRYGPFEDKPSTTAETLERLSTHEPSYIPELETPDPYAYLGDQTRMELAVANQRKRATIQAGMNRARMRAAGEERALLNELEAAGVDFAEAEQRLSVSPEKFDRVKRSFEDTMRGGQGIPPKLVTEIHDRTIPAILRDPNYQVKFLTAKHVEKEFDAFRTAMLQDKRVKDVKMVGSVVEKGGSEKDLDILIELHDNVGKKWAERYAIGEHPEVGNQAADIAMGNLVQKIEDIGFIDYELEMGGIDIFVEHRGRTVYVDIGGHPSEAVRPTVMDYYNDPRKTSYGERLRVGMAKRLNEGLPKGSGARITPEEIFNASKDPILREKMAKLMERRIRNQPYYKNKEQGFMEMSLMMRLAEMTAGGVVGGAVDEENRLRGAAIGALTAFALGTVLRYGKGLGEAGAVEVGGPKVMKKMQEKVVRAAEIEGPVEITAPAHTRGETKARGMRRDIQKDMFGKATRSGMGRDELRAWAVNTYGKGISEMKEAELIVANQDLTRRLALSKMFPAEQLDKAVKVRNIEDLAMELHGAKAQKRIDAAVRRTVGAHRDLTALNEQELTGVLEILPKRFLRTRGLGALIRQPLAVEDVMNRMGTWGKYITRQVRRERLHTDYLWSKWFSPLQEEIKHLTPAQMDEVVAALHPMEANGRQVIIPEDPKLQSIALRIRQDLNEIGHARAEIGDPIRLANGGERPFEMMDDYYPLHIPPDELTSSIKIKRRIIEHLMESGQASGPAEALSLYDDFIRKSVTNRFGNLDYAREAWLEPEKFDLLRDLSRYYYGAARRISRHKFYGGTGSTQLPDKMTKWLDGLRQDVGPDEFQYAHQAMTRHFKHEAVDDAMSDMLKRVRSFETIAHMGLAQIMNSSEPVHTAVFAGFQNFAKGFARAIRGTSRMDAREIVARNAAAVGSTIRDLFGEAGGAGSLTGKFLKYSGFSPIEKWNRKLASHVGIQYIEGLVSKLQRNPGSTRLRKMLDEVLISGDDVLRNGLSEEQLIKGAMELSNRTQKRTGVIDMPMFMSHPMGRIVAMFKTFAYGSARLMVRDFVLGARTNPERLLRLLVAFPVVGELVGDVRNAMTGNVRDTEGLVRLAENYAYVGTMGILYDFFRSVQFGEGSIQSFMVGPVGSDIASIISGTHDWLAEGKGRKLGKQALRMLPPPATLLRGEAGQQAILGRELFPRPTKTWQIP